MRLTTERKVCAGVLSLAAAALAVDRLLLGGATGPAAAAADVADYLDDLPAPSATADGRPGTVPVARQIEALATAPYPPAGGPPLPEVDAFEPPAGWAEAIARAQAAASSENPSAAPSAPRDDSAERRRALLKRMGDPELTAVLVTGGVPSNIVIHCQGPSGRITRLMRVGESLGDFRLMTLDKDVAQFVSPEKEVVELRLPLSEPTPAR